MKQRVVCGGTVLGFLLVVGLWLEASVVAQQPNAPFDWQVRIWKGFNILPPVASQVSDKVTIGPAEVTFNADEAGKLVYVVEDQQPTKNVSSQDEPSGELGSQIVLHEVGSAAFAAKNHLEKVYSSRLPKQPLNTTGWPIQVSHPQFSPNGRYVLLRFSVDSVRYFPFVLDTKEDNPRGIVARDANGVITPGASDAVAWSPDNYHIASFEPSLAEDSGETLGELDFRELPRRVYVQDWRTNQRAVATQAVGVISPLAWLNARTLLYASLPQDKKRRYELFDVTGRLPRPNIYTYSLNTKRTQLLVKDGYRPYPSPDGKMIAFFGSPDPSRPKRLKTEQGDPSWLWRYISNGASLCVAKADGSQRVAFQPYSGLYPRIQWLPDNRRFVTIERTKPGPNFEAEITLWNIETQAFRKLATLQASSAETPNDTNPYDVIDFPFYPMGTSGDGKRMFVKLVSRQSVNPKRSLIYRPAIDVLQSIDIETGKVSTIATVTGASGVDWHPNASLEQSGISNPKSD